jgi:hypothetical protein
VGNWTGGRRRTKPQKIKHPKTLIVADPIFFARRDKRGNVTDPVQWSPDMLEAVLAKWELIVVFEEIHADHPISNFLKLYKEYPIKLIPYEFGKVEDVTSQWKTALLELGATFKRARNPREITYLNLYRFMEGKHLHWVGADDHRKIKIKLDKAKTFMELQAKRRTKAEW